jgi:hypothetical protein
VRAAVGEVFYNVSVNPAEMWWEVGKVFQRARLDKGWTLMDVQMHGGPTGNASRHRFVPWEPVGPSADQYREVSLF